MNREDRAKQFAPFDALTGLREALKRKESEHERQAKKELSEDEIAKINDVMTSLEKGDVVRLTRYYNGRYIVIEDALIGIDPLSHKLLLKNCRIPFSDIMSIEKLISR